MKTRFLKSALVLLFMMIGVNFVSAQIGPVVSVSENKSSLPPEIITFISSYFPAATVKEVELKTIEGAYEIELNNNYDLKFVKKTSQWLQIDAPDNSIIPQILVKDLLPGEIYNVLVRNNVVYVINEMTYNPAKGYKIETTGDKEFYFDLNGNKIRRF